MLKPKTYNPDLLHPELSHAIIGAAFDVHNELGPGWDEWDYHRAMLEALRTKGLTAESHLRKKLIHRNEPVDEFELDILVGNQILLELKHIRTGFAAQHYTQLINYLKCWEKDLGILINFGLERLNYQRVPYTPESGIICFDGCWDSLTANLPELREKLHVSCQNILEAHGIGYGEESFKRILLKELCAQKLNPETPVVSPRFKNIRFESRPTNSILLNRKILILATAFHDTTAANLARLRSEMKQLAIPFGILMNSGKSNLTLRGVVL
jgi:GxxExxY protein